MKTTSIITILVLACTCCFAQKEFEGKVHFVQDITITSPEVDSATLYALFGGTSIYSYKKGKLRWDVEGAAVEYQISNLNTNTHVLKFLPVDTLFKMDYSKQETLLDYKITRNADTICGYVCDKIETLLRPTTPGAKDYKRTVWFTSKLYTDPKPFKNLGMYAMHQVMPVIKAVPLGIVIEMEAFTLKFTAVKVEPVSINDNVFVSDKSLPLSDRLWDY